MTAEDRYVLDLADLRAVRLECSACGAAVTIPIAQWEHPINQCPSCSTPWQTTPQAYEMINQLSVALRTITAMMKHKTTYRVRFELERPKPAGGG